MSGSVPSKLVFLSDLLNLQDRDKVRFLGCVENYDIKSGHLVLKHNYPRSERTVTASVDLYHVRENVKSTALEIGAWVNVVGYVMNEGSTTYGAGDQKGARDAAEKLVHVQAIMMWEAVAVQMDEYEKAVQARKDIETTS